MRILRLLFAAGCLAVALALLGFLWFVIAALAPPSEPQRHTDGIAALTGGAERVETALHLLADNKADYLIISGAHHDTTLADLARLADLDPVPLAARVTIGRRADSTRSNAVEIAEWARALHIRSIRVVTAGYHMPRALLEMQREMPDVEMVPNPVWPPALRGTQAALKGRTWHLLAGEYLKLLGAWAGLSRPRWATD